MHADFLVRRLTTLFTVRAYLLDPAECGKPIQGIATPQLLPDGREPIDGNPLNGLIRINEIPAQRGLGDSASNREDIDDHEVHSPRETRKLSEQLRSYD